MRDKVNRRDTQDRSRPPPGSALPGLVRRVGPRRIVDWLTRGAGDIVACRGRSLVFGLCYVAAGHAIARAHEREVAWLDGIVAGFLFLGPLLAVGTYELSRQRERGERSELTVALFAWCRNPRELSLYAALLCAVLLVWLQLSWALLGRADLPGDAGFTFSPLLWWVVWVGFAMVAFVAGVVAVPILLDRPISVLNAVRTSLACCLKNSLTMGVWALTTASLVGASMWLGFWPLLLIGPWLGHATWHVYRDCVVEQPDQALVWDAP